jgi:hypothetical protein
MKKIQFLSVIALIGAIFMPSLAFAVSPLDGLIQAPVLEMPKILLCTVEGSIKRTSNTTNQISYKVHYGSNYPKLGAAFSVVGSVEHPTAVVSVYKLSGNTMFKSTEGYLYFNGKQENTFTFPIKNNPGVNVRVTVDGVVCAPLFFKTIQPLAGISSSFGVPVIALDPNASIFQNGNLVPSVAPSANAGGTVNSNDAAIGGVVISQSGGNSAQGGSVAPSGGNAPVAAVDQGAQANSAPVQDITNDPAQKVVITDETGNSAVLEKADDQGVADNLKAETEPWQAKDVAIVGLLGSIFVALVVYIVLKYRGMM